MRVGCFSQKFGQLGHSWRKLKLEEGLLACYFSILERFVFLGRKRT